MSENKSLEKNTKEYRRRKAGKNPRKKREYKPLNDEQLKLLGWFGGALILAIVRKEFIKDIVDKLSDNVLDSEIIEETKNPLE